MNKAGAILGVIAGIFGFLAAIFTLLFGGLAGAFGAKEAGTVVGLGWGGIAFSFLVIIFGAVAFAKPKGAGIGLIICSIGGAILGGTFVAICMVLSLVGGVLCVMGAKNVLNTPDQIGATESPLRAGVPQQTEARPWSTGRMVTYGLFSFFAPLIGVIAGIIGLLKEPTRKQGATLLMLALGGVVMYSAISSSSKSGTSSSTTSSAVANKYDELAVTPAAPLPAQAQAQASSSTQPEQEAAIEQIGICKGLDLTVTSDQLECLDKKFVSADKQLNEAYKRLMTNLDDSRKSAIKKEQVAWIEEKKNKCDQAGKEFEGGTMEAVLIADCMVEMTKKRLDYLKNFQ